MQAVLSEESPAQILLHKEICFLEKGSIFCYLCNRILLSILFQSCLVQVPITASKAACAVLGSQNQIKSANKTFIVSATSELLELMIRSGEIY